MLAAAAAARNAVPDGFAPLQGEWTVRAAEQGGQLFDVVVGGTLGIDGTSFDLRTAVGNEFSGDLRLDATKSPMQIDFLLDAGAVWHGIYTVSGDVFRLNYVEADSGAERPSVFATTADTPGTVIVMARGRE